MHILIRFDDICPTMDFVQWGRAMEILEKYNIKPLIGVIPDCQDPDLQIEEPHSDFWDYIKELQNRGFAIAMHGYIHVYDTKTRGLVNHSYHSEFAGHSYEVQYEKIRKGKDLLKSHGIETEIFFAPAHSYDDVTLMALRDNGFKFLSDGATYKPIEKHGVKCIPCLFSGAKVPFMNYKTYVFHAHEWKDRIKEAEYCYLKKICERHCEEIEDFHTYSMRPCGNKTFQELFQIAYLFYDRHVWPIILKLYRKIR